MAPFLPSWLCDFPLARGCMRGHRSLSYTPIFKGKEWRGVGMYPNATAGFLDRADAETPPNFREFFQFFSESISQWWISTAKVWISAPDVKIFVFIGFWVYTAVFGFSARGQMFLRCLSSKFESLRTSSV